MRTCCYDLGYVVALECLNISLGEHVGQVFITSSTCHVAGTVLFCSKDAEVYACDLHELSKRLRGLLGTLIVGASTSYPEEHFH